MLRFIIRLLCALCFGVGLYFIVQSVFRINQLAQYTGFTKALSDYFLHNPQWNSFIVIFGAKPQMPPAYDSSVFLSLNVGFVLLIASFLIYRLTFWRKNSL